MYFCQFSRGHHWLKIKEKISCTPPQSDLLWKVYKKKQKSVNRSWWQRSTESDSILRRSSILTNLRSHCHARHFLKNWKWSVQLWFIYEFLKLKKWRISANCTLLPWYNALFASQGKMSTISKYKLKTLFYLPE
jgi:hypothetical protein